MARTKPLRSDSSKPHNPPLGLWRCRSLHREAAWRWQMQGPSLPHFCPPPAPRSGRLPSRCGAPGSWAGRTSGVIWGQV